MEILAFTERVLILGTNPLARKIAEAIETAIPLRYSIVGFVDDGYNGGTAPVGSTPSLPYPIIGPLDRLEKTIKELCPDRIIVALSERSRLPVQDLLDSRIAGVLVEDGIEVYERFTRKLAIESLPPSSLIFSKDLKKPRLHMALRRVFSLAFAALGLILAAPLMVIIALAIKLDSKGPVFFLQARAGKHGRVFNFIKFRTMQSEGDPNDSVWVRDDSQRVTQVGKWLRRFYLDELPQFINTLKGDMDLVGPRPEMASNVKTMSEQIPYYSFRSMVRPGITGWAQIKNGYSVSQEDVTEKVRYDLYYIKHMSLWFDLRIVMATVKIVLFGHGGSQ
jgi:exopolysaccharide biosynthesis polyprenyl glycosylphosphotransferase